MYDQRRGYRIRLVIECISYTSILWSYQKLVSGLLYLHILQFKEMHHCVCFIRDVACDILERLITA